jgi:hypothetical protein
MDILEGGDWRVYQGLVIFLGQYLVKQNLEPYNETKLLGRFSSFQIFW